MKNTITLLFILFFLPGRSQNVIADFESFSLPPNSYYKDTNSVDWQTTNASFQYDWTKSAWGDYWSAGFSYTNKKDSTNGGSTNLYNAITYNGYNLSNYYISAQPTGFIRIKAPGTGVVGFYVTNTTYAYKSMQNGDLFAKKFGDTTGTKCGGCPQGSIPDWFKLTVRGYSGGNLKTDSVEFYLADFRFANSSQDYILRSWQWVDCNKLGAVDSIKFYLSSSDNSFGFMNTPAFFCIDNFTTGQGVGIAELNTFGNIKVFPNPAKDMLNINMDSERSAETSIRIYNIQGILMNEEKVNFNSGNNGHTIDLNGLNTGLYFVEVNNGTQKQNFKIVKE